MLDALWEPIAPALGVPLVTGLVAVIVVLAIAGLRLRRQNTRLTLALSNTPQGLCMWDPAARLLVCNDRYVACTICRRRSSGRARPCGRS